MRAVPALALLLAFSTLAAADEGRFVERDGWTEFVPAWQQGPANLTFENRSVWVEADEWYATDGEGWFYAVRGQAPGPDGYDGCAAADARDEGIAVAVNASCALHPSVSCSATRVCERAMGVTGPSGPPPLQTPTNATPPTNARGPTPSDEVLDSCGRTVAMGACTPAPGAWAAIAAAGAVALLARRTSA